MHQAQLWFVMRAACRALSLQVGVHVPIEDAWAVYSQQPTFSGAPWFPGVHSAWWRPKRTADKSSAAPCVALHLYFLLLLVATWLAGQTMDAPSAVVVCDACCLSCTFPASWGARSHRGRMAVYSQQPTFSGHLGFLVYIRLVASKTNCRQVECCSLCCAASIFLPLLVATWLAGQTMDAPSAVVVCECVLLVVHFPYKLGCTFP